MSRRRSAREPSISFHMNTRSRAQKTSIHTTSSSEEPFSSTSSTTLAASSEPSVTPSATPPSDQKTLKRKLSETDLNADGGSPEAKRPAQESNEMPPPASAVPLEVPITTATNLEATPVDPDISNTEVAVRKHQTSNSEESDSRSPKRAANASGRGRKGIHRHGPGNRRGKHKGRRGRGGDSPEPPNRKRPLTQDERVEISMLKARQHELKKFFSAVGAQQVDILDQLASRDLSKLARKPKAHQKVPEYETVIDGLNSTMEDIQDLMRTRKRVQLEQEMQRLDLEKEVIEQQFKARVKKAHEEHLKGAEGDIILFERAYREDHDETHTETGSEFGDYLRYHELPEPDTHPRGYVSERVMDEKPFKLQLATYDERARQQVLDEDIIAPLLREMEERDRENREQEELFKSQKLSALTHEALKELDRLTERELLTQVRVDSDTSGSFKLSTLADVAIWRRPTQISHRPPPFSVAPNDAFPRPYSPRPDPLPPVARPVPPPNSFKHILNFDIPSPMTNRGPSQASESTDRSSPRISSNGPGQHIAPAPPRAAPRFQVFRHTPNGRTGFSSAGQGVGGGPQQYIFQPPQQPVQYHPAPGRTPPPAQSGNGLSGSRADRPGRSGRTFVNQTIETLNPGSSGKDGNPHPKGGQRILLPKM
ncbi:hypothetical protein PV08_00526 [Exophiala spinifera]|uniref:Uncharacterized protein n=1 Tax=Exophiala spinifera TaxID=91928 RepID=A0A0D1YXF6_9EURO|nr:uncharacterized protein PV08_00526 [Exophiala spinifera]KIW19951.1 hypothetical protein PV08_00526 [Exophiala spinifera]